MTSSTSDNTTGNTANVSTTFDTFNREQAEQWLVDSDINYITQSDFDFELLRDYIWLGFKGYANFTDAELIAEIEQRKEINNLK